MVIGKGSKDRFLDETEVGSIVSEALATLPLEGKRVLIIIPDGTRTMPMPLMFGLFEAMAGSRAVSLDYLVALGTHSPMSDAQLSRLVGRPVVNGKAGQSHIFNHQWNNPDTFKYIGTIPAEEIGQITGRIDAAGCAG